MTLLKIEDLGELSLLRLEERLSRLHLFPFVRFHLGEGFLGRYLVLLFPLCGEGFGEAFQGAGGTVAVEVGELDGEDYELEEGLGKGREGKRREGAR